MDYPQRGVDCRRARASQSDGNDSHYEMIDRLSLIVARAEWKTKCIASQDLHVLACISSGLVYLFTRLLPQSLSRLRSY